VRRAGQSWVWSIDSLHHPRLMRQSRYITHATCGLARSITHVFCGLARSITHALFVLSPTPPQKIINVFNGLKWFSTAVTRARFFNSFIFNAGRQRPAAGAPLRGSPDQVGSPSPHKSWPLARGLDTGGAAPAARA
jgi:hypothetical protein